MINDNKLTTLIKKSENLIWQKKDGKLYFSNGFFAIETTDDRFNKYYPKTRGAIYERFGGFCGKESLVDEFFKGANFETTITDTNLKYLDNKIFRGEKHYTFINEKLISIIKDLKNVEMFNEASYSPVYFIDDSSSDRVLLMPVRVVEEIEHLKSLN